MIAIVASHRVCHFGDTRSRVLTVAFVDMVEGFFAPLFAVVLLFAAILSIRLLSIMAGGL